MCECVCGFASVCVCALEIAVYIELYRISKQKTLRAQEIHDSRFAIVVAVNRPTAFAAKKKAGKNANTNTKQKLFPAKKRRNEIE